MARTCIHCGLGPRQGRELRPYGPEGKPVCFPCMRETPEREATAQAQMSARLEGLGAGPLIATGEGLRPAADVVGGMRCARCGHAPTERERDRMVEILASPLPAGDAAVRSIRGFVCDACTRAGPMVCASCSQPILVGVANVDADGRPRHEGACPDWLAELERDRDRKREVDELERATAIADALERGGGAS